MRIYQIIATLIIFIVIMQSALAQKMIIPQGVESNRMVNFVFTYTFFEPYSDLGKRFNQINQVGFGVQYKTSTNWLALAEASYQFGPQPNEPALMRSMANGSGYVSNASGFPAEITLGQRGLMMHGKVGRFFPLLPNNKNSGIIVMAGAGYYMHKIHIGLKRNDIPPLLDDLIRGYDMMSGGICFNQFIGYQHHSKNKYYNFFAGIELMQAITRSYRGFNYATMQEDKNLRNDNAIGLRFGWMIPIYLTKSGSEEYMYR
jgi:hypothetical protein